jgi:O-antigen/teichoic acid export membrane protein
LRLVAVLAGAVILSRLTFPLSTMTQGVLSIASLTLIIMGLDAALIAALQGLENMRRIAMAEVAGKATLLVFGITVLETGHGVVAPWRCSAALVGFFNNPSLT